MDRRKTRSPRVGSRGFWIVIATLALAGAGLRLWTSDRGQAFLVRHGLSRQLIAQAGTRLDVALARSFLDLGLLRGDVKARVVTERGRRVREYVFRAPGHRTPTQCHVEIQRACGRVHAEIVAAEERHEPNDELVLRCGYGRVVTHRIVVRPPSGRAVARSGARGPRIALVIDDLGHNLNSTARGFLELGVPVTLAVLPDRPKSRATFQAARERDIPTLLHLPMEAAGGDDAGDRAVRVGMSAAAIDALIERHEQRYRSFIGVNNHMGSRATGDAATMRALFEALRARDLVFVDSQTTARSLGRAIGRETGVWCIANDMFLDDGGGTEAAVAANLQRLAALARRRGLAVGIAHPHPETLAALRRALPRLQAEGFAFVTLADLRPAPEATHASR